MTGSTTSSRRSSLEKNVLGRLDVAKVFEYWDHTSTSLYDPLEPTRGAEKPLVLTRDNVPANNKLRTAAAACQLRSW